MPDKKYLIEIPDMPEGSGVWDADRWERNKDLFMKDNPDAKVFEIGDYDPEDSQEHDQIMLSFEDEEKSGVWDNARWERNKDLFMQDNPDAVVNRVRYVDYWGQKAEENRARKNELMQPDEQRNAKLAELGYYDDLTGGQVDFEFNAPSTIGLQPLSSAIKTNSVSGETEYLDPKVQEFFAQDSAQTDRMAEIAKLDSEYDENPAVIEYRKMLAEQQAEQDAYADKRVEAIKSEIEKIDSFKAARGAALKRNMSEEIPFQPLYETVAGKEAESGQENEKLEKYMTALKFYEKANHVREHGGKGFVHGIALTNADKIKSLGYGAADTFKGMALDKATQSDLEAYNEIGGILSNLEKKLGNLKEENITPEVLEKNLSKEDMELILAFFEYNSTLSDAKKDMSKWYKGGKIFAESVPFMLEFLVTGGLYEGASKAGSNLAKKGLTKALAGLIYKMGAKRAGAVVSKAGKALAGAALGTLARTLVAPGTYKRMAEATTQIDDEGHMHRGKDAFKSFVDAYIENLSEISGGLIGKGLGIVGKGAGAILAKTPLAKYGQMLGDTRLMQFVSKSWKAVAPKLKQLGFHGFPEEIGEEFIGNAIREITIQPGALKEMVEDDNFGAMIIGFAPTTFFGAGVGAVNVGYVNAKASSLGKSIREMFSHAYGQENIDHMMSVMQSAETPEQMQQAVKPIAKAILQAEAQGMITKDQANYEIETLYEYAGYMASNKALLFGQKEQDRKLAEAKEAEYQQKFGKFWQENEEGEKSVQIAKLNNGKTVFVVSAPEADGQVSIVDATTGKHGYANIADIATQEVEVEGEKKTESMTRTTSVDDFINERIAMERQSSEQNRMLRERQTQIDALARNVRPGTKLNLGTEGMPIDVFVKGTNQAGVVVVDQNGGQNTLGWEQVADFMGQPIRVKTDQEISDEMVDAKVAEWAKRRKASRSASPLVQSAAENASVEAANVVAEEQKHIPMNEDGTVNEVAFWEQDPEGFAKWNDEQNKDGGQDTLQQIAMAKIELTALLDEQVAAQNTSNPTLRKAAKAEAARLAERIARIGALEQSYMDTLQEEKKQVEQTKARPTAEMTEQDLEQMDQQYQNIFGKTKVRAERVRIMQEYLDKLSEGSVPVVLLSTQDYAERLKQEGASDAVIARVAEQMKMGKVAGFMTNGKTFVMYEVIPSIEDSRITYVHERQHELNKQNPAYIQAMVGAVQGLGGKKTMLKILETFVGNKAIKAYKSLGVRGLADEIICRAMEIAYSNAEFSVALQQLGVPQEVINIIEQIDNEQRGNRSLAHARRRGGRTAHADLSGRENAGENGRDNRQVSGGLLGEQGTGSVGSGEGRTETRGSGEPGAVDSDENIPLRVITPEEDAAYIDALSERFNMDTIDDMPEANLSEETKEELAEKDLVMEGGAIMSTEYAELKHETGYATPNERNIDTDDVRFSVVTKDAWKANYLQHPEAEARVANQLDLLAQRMVANEFVNSVISHGEHKYGKAEKGSFAGPLRTNDEYIVTFDMDTTCPRTFQFLEYVKKIERRVGRPLTQVELIQLTEMMRMYGQMIPCVYCYAENKRQALKESYSVFMNARYNVLKAKTDEEAIEYMYGHKANKTGTNPDEVLTEAAAKVFRQWRAEAGKAYNPTMPVLYRQYMNDRDSILSLLDFNLSLGKINANMSDDAITKKIVADLRVTDVKASRVIEELVEEWKWDTIEGKEHDDFHRVDEDDMWVNEQALSVWRDMTSYAKSSSSAKTVVRYTPYTDELKKLSQEQRDHINGMGGVRMHSTNDFRIDYVFDYFQFMADMAANKMLGHTYTKSPEFVRIFGNSGYKINMSIAAYQDSDGTVRPNVDEGFDWNEAQELRRFFPNAGVMLMATSDEQLQMALDSEWIDMCIPFHKSGLPKVVWYNMRLWKDYEPVQKELFYNNTEMKQMLIEDGVEIPKGASKEQVEQIFLEHFNITVLTDEKGERIKPHFLPGPSKDKGVDIPGHYNDHQTYLDLCRQYGVKPRFKGVKVKDNSPEGQGRTVDITEHPSYMKVIKETARTDTPQTPVQFNFDQPSEALGGRTPIDYAFEELEARAMAESQIAGGKVGDIYNSLKQDPYGIVNQFMDTIIKHKKETGKDYPLDYLTPDSREWFMVQRKALEEAFQGVNEIPYHRNVYDEQGNLIEGVGLENARKAEEERIAAEEKAAKEAEKAAKKAAREAERAAKKAAKKGAINLMDEAAKAVEGEVMMRFIGEQGAARLDAAYKASNMVQDLDVAKDMEHAGKDAKAIKAATGWERGADRKWRYETKDFEFKGKPGTKTSFKLSELIKDINLFKAYPELKDVRVRYTQLPKGVQGQVATERGKTVIKISIGQYKAQNPVIEKAAAEFIMKYPDVFQHMSDGTATPEERELFINTLAPVFDANDHYVDEFGGKNTLIHEIQHVIQDIEGFAKGGNTNMVDLSDPGKRRQHAHLKTRLEEEHNRFQDLQDQRTDVFKRGVEQEQKGNRAEALALRQEYDRLLKEQKLSRQRILGIEMMLKRFAKLGKEGYRRLAGEVESRIAEARMDMTDEQRRQSLMTDTIAEMEEVATEDQIFIMDNIMMGYDEMAGVSFRITPEMDAKYLAAVEAGDMETAQRMVNEAAKLAMPNTKVVDENGEPLVVWRASRYSSYEPYTKFSKERAEGRGFYFTNRESAEDIYGGKNLRAFFINAKNPDMSNNFNALQAPAEAVMEDGVDGIFFAPNGVDDKTFEVRVFEPNQIKSAEPVTYDNDGNVIPLSERFNPENSDIRFRFTPRTEEQREKLFADAKEKFGVTNNFKVAGYMLPDGSLLDFSEANDGGDPNVRSLDHRSIEDVIMEDGTEYESRWMYLADFMNEGAIRLLPEYAGINLMKAPTKEQRQRLMDFIYKYNGEVILEIADERLNNAAYVEYDRRTSPSRIFRDIDGYFNEGIVPQQDIRFRIANENQAIFVSNAAKAVEGIKQEKATPEQWLKMIEKNGGLKAGEDKWMGLSDFLKASDKKTLTKQELLDFINENAIKIEEVHYADKAEDRAAETHSKIERILQNKFDDYVQKYYEEHEDDDLYGDEAKDYAMDKLHEEFGDEFPYTIERSYYDVYLTFPYEEVEDLENWAAKVGIDFKAGNPINDTRLNYTTENLDNKREIALTVPTIESWNEDDDIHFGDAGEGRAVAWIRFGETTTESGEKVLVIDEIQSKRHQEGRESGYDNGSWDAAVDEVAAATGLEKKYVRENPAEASRYIEMTIKTEEGKALAQKLLDASQSRTHLIPDAPFEKNWHELAMKRMLRYAAENGYDVVAWTKGAQQAERYDIGGVISEIKATKYPRGYEVESYDKNGRSVLYDVYPDASAIADVYGKEVAQKIVESADAVKQGDKTTISGDNLQVGGEGMKGFYDKMLPAFMNKYGKKWGVKVEDITLPNVEEAGRVMHSVPVTEEMKESVMEGQVMFRTVSPEVRAREEFAKTLYAKVLQNQFNDVTLQEIQNYIDYATDSVEPYSFYKRLPEAAVRDLLEGERAVAVDALISRISESTVPATERASQQGREQIEKNKKELLKQWAIASDMWYDDLSQVEEIADTVPLDAGQDSIVYISTVNNAVIKVKRGKPFGKRFRPDIDDLALYNHVFPDTFYTLIGYGDFGEGIAAIVMQPLVNFAEDASVSVEERVEHMRKLGFEPIGKEKTAFTNGYIVASDIHKRNIVRDVDGNIRVIDADMKLHTKDVGGKHVIPPVEKDWGGGPLFEDEDVDFRVVTDQDLIDWFNDTAKVSAYRAVQINSQADIFSPMASSIRYKDNKNTAAGMMQIDEAVENPHLVAMKDGKPVLKKGENGGPDYATITFLDEDGGRTTAAYNPYGHCCVNSMMNDQFKRAYDRDELYVVRVSAPASEISSGYRAEMAKDAVGIHKWKTGPVGSKLPEAKRRQILLTRWMRNEEVMTWEAVAQDWIETLKGENIKVPFNVVPRKILNMLVDGGVKIVAPQSGMEVAIPKYEQWLADPVGYVGDTELPAHVKALNEQAKAMREIQETGDVSFRMKDDVKISGSELGSIAGDIFEALPEGRRSEITSRLNGNILGLQDAIMQIPTDLAVKEQWSDEDKATAKAVKDAVNEATGAGLTAAEALWALYNANNRATDLISEASRALVKRNLGFSQAAAERHEMEDDYIRFRTVRNDMIDATTDMYNYEASLWTERLKESWLDMNQSVESLQKALAKGSGMEIEPWENVVFALNRLSSKSYADKKKYMRDFLNPMWDAVIDVMEKAKLKVEDVERYMMLKHGLERNRIFAARDAKEFYRSMYGVVAERMKNQSHAQQVVALSEAKKALDEIDAKMANAKDAALARLQESRRQAEQDVRIAELVLRGDEKQNEQDLQDRYDAIDAGLDAKYREFREKDYGGLTSMFVDVTPVKRSEYKSEEAYHKAILAGQKPKYTTVADMEKQAQQEVDEFENKVNTEELWKRTNAATKETLRHQHASGMITDEQYDAVRDMFEYYVPLRGFADNTAEDMYSYYMTNSAGGFAKPIIAAKGRTTRAESPLGWIGTMAESGIQADNKNDAKMCLYYAVMNRPDQALATITDTWFEGRMENGRKVFRPVYPPKTDRALTADELRDHVAAWENDMKQKAANGMAYRGSLPVNLKGSVVFQDAKEKEEHIVRVKVAGKDYSIVINGNPRAAQAINGLLNPDASLGPVGEWIGAARRNLSALLTSYSPLFWVANFQRDLLSSFMRVSQSDGWAQAFRYLNNRRNAWRAASYIYKYDNGTMGDSYYEQMYKEFAENGGITGYTALTTNKEYEKLFEDYARQMGRPVSRAVKGAWEKFMGFGEAIEQVTRFAAYLTAREAGKSIEEAVYAAKEVSVNFNRKGSAKPISMDELDKLRTKSGKPLNKMQRLAAIIFSAMPKGMKALYYFFNASIQATSSTANLAKKSPGKAAAWAGMYFGMSLVMAAINYMLSGGDDDEEYIDLPDYLRESTLLVSIGDGYYLKWSIPQEMRPFYAYADLIMRKRMGKMPHKNLALEMALATAQWLPVNPFDSEDPLLSLMPDFGAPIAEAVANKTSFGGKVYNDMPFKSEEVVEQMPAYRKATSKTGKVYIDMAEFLNDVTGGDEVQKGWANINPAVVEHLVEGYGGGVYDFAKMMVSIPGMVLSDDPVQIKDIPFVNKVLLSTDETNMYTHTNEAYNYYRTIADNAKRVEGEYRASDDPARADAYRAEEDYRVYLLHKQYEDDFKDVKERLDKAVDEEEIAALRKEQNVLREMFLDDIAQNTNPDPAVQIAQDVKLYEKELRERLKPVTDADKERLARKKDRDWKGMNRARKQRDSLKRLPEFKEAEQLRKDLRELKKRLEELNTMETPAQRDSFLDSLQIDYDDFVKRIGTLK